MYCGYGSAVRWAEDRVFSEHADHDAVECVTILFLPVFPLKAYHTYDWSGNVCKALEIRRTPGLILGAMARPYLLGLFGISAFILAVCGSVIGWMFLAGSRPAGSAALRIRGRSASCSPACPCSSSWPGFLRSLTGPPGKTPMPWEAAF